jgi:hypothetical protein
LDDICNNVILFIELTAIVFISPSHIHLYLVAASGGNSGALQTVGGGWWMLIELNGGRSPLILPPCVHARDVLYGF